MSNIRLLTWAFTALCTLTACGDDDGSSDAVTSGTTCAELCPALEECDEAAGADCQALCEAQREVFNATAWDAFTGCVMQSSCSNPDACLQVAIEATTTAPAERFLTDLCQWAAGCSGGVLTVSSCKSAIEQTTSQAQAQSEEIEVNPWDMMRLLSSSTLSCMSGCFAELSCDNTEFDSASTNCVESCGLDTAFSELVAEEDGTGSAASQ